HVISPSGDPVISSLSAAGAVAGEIKPRVIREVSLDAAFVIAVDCARLARPAVLHAEHPRTWTFENITLVVNHHGLNAEEGKRRRTRLQIHGARQRRDQDAAGFRLPPGIYDRAAPIADHVIIPAPRLRVDRLADRAKQADGLARRFLDRLLPFTH